MEERNLPSQMGNLSILKAEGFLRLFSLLFAVSSACLVGFDSQTKVVFFSIKKKATDRDLPALSILVMVEGVVAGYNLIQLCKCMIFAGIKERPSGCNKGLAWTCFLLDQMVAYVSFAATSAATQASFLAITGASHLQWSKLCNVYTRFCEQIAGGLVCGFAASLIMTTVGAISAFHLFRRYSSKQFLVLK
ncbi:CASP-like protein 2C1 [Magnolia sinica]|uniref:CASP-like protein 2C1 n=1 Tax=Magnolia sinica TaxID=86752 RepID=UPI002657EE3F|nr:CASP-like protein 2C1 [Magnolia sinica]